jgi:hypothetical protein
MEINLKTLMAESITRRAKLEVIDAACGICSLQEPELLIRLEELWFKGFTAGCGAQEALLKSVSLELSKITIAHLSGDQGKLKAALDDFCARHVHVVNAGDKPGVTH